VRLFEGQAIGNRPLLLFGILLLFTGLQLVTLGLLAEMQARTYHESQGKPTYYIREMLDAYDRQALAEPGTQAADGSLPVRGTDESAPVPVARV